MDAMRVILLVTCRRPVQLDQCERATTGGYQSMNSAVNPNSLAIGQAYQIFDRPFLLLNYIPKRGAL